MNYRDTNYARYITIGAISLLIVVIAGWLYISMPEDEKNTDPKKGFVCMDTSCHVKKKCDVSTLVIYTQVPTAAEPSLQRVSNSYECQSR